MISAMRILGKTKEVAPIAQPREADMTPHTLHPCDCHTGVKLLGGPRRVKGKALGAGLLLLAAGLAACAEKGFVPESPHAAGPILQEVPGLIVAIESDAWNGRPSGLADTVLPLLVTLRNTGARTVAVARQDFALLDQANRQYLPIPPGDVVAMYGGGGGSGTAVYPSIGFGGSSRGGSFVGGGLGLSFGSWGSDIRDIVPLALADGPIQAGAEVRGFLYFPRPAPDNQAVRLVAMFRDLPGTPQLEFRFHRAE
jgi:hypothetical protein